MVSHFSHLLQRFTKYSFHPKIHGNTPEQLQIKVAQRFTKYSFHPKIHGNTPEQLQIKVAYCSNEVYFSFDKIYKKYFLLQNKL